MAPKAKPHGTGGGGTPPATKDATTDPMLQGTYEQDDSSDFQPATDEIAAFEARLRQQGSSRPSAASSAHTAGASADPQRLSAAGRRPAARQHASPPSSSSPSPPSRAVPPSHGVGHAAAHRAADRRMSEEEQAAQVQRGEDVEDVRHLEDRFRNDGSDDDSDDETVARRRKMLL